MRLINATFVVLAAALLASGTTVSKADQTNVSNLYVVHSSHGLAGANKRNLRSHPTAKKEDKLPEHDEEERMFGEKLLSAFRIQKAQQDTNYRRKLFRRWKKHQKSADDLKNDIPASLYDTYAAFRRMYG
ncbi:Avirulence (Avh) protein [Phytophthora megakarya]|uniref:RxLR effector protein n=1 Tax=Phytophthora megakarya TaxID=4795 RepID=A0A225V4B7_9STRA|nr:Avirulence (Avh) protein [Phytophthora megakarya]